MQIGKQGHARYIPADPGSNVAVDWSVLAGISKGEASVERELIGLFRRLNDQDVESLYKALALGDIASAVRASHRISGAGCVIGAAGLAAVCNRLESAGRARDWDAVQASMFEFAHEMERVNACLDAY
jgi:HPt (histidine-containing phosphotransfer) domain-containing protein